MEGLEDLIAPAVIGVGCRSGVRSETIVAAVEETLALAPIPVRLIGMHTSSRKRSARGLREAAARLELELHFHGDEELRAMEPRVASPSLRVQRLVGVVSVAEAAALLGGFAGASLIVPKHSAGGVSCAIALAEEVRA